MKSILPQPELLPIRVNIFIQKSDGQKHEVHGMFQVKPYETIDCLIGHLKEFYASKQNEVVKCNLEKIQITGPLY